MFFWMHFKWFWIKAWAHSVKLKENFDFWQTVLIEVSPKYLMWVMHTKKVHTHTHTHPPASLLLSDGWGWRPCDTPPPPDMGQWPGVKAATFPSWTEHQPAGNMFLLQQCLVRITITSPRFFCTRRYRGHQQVSQRVTNSFYNLPSTFILLSGGFKPRTVQCWLLHRHTNLQKYRAVCVWFLSF